MQKKRKLNFNSNNTEEYNHPFTENEIRNVINESYNTATGPDKIHYKFLKQLPPKSTKYLLNILNEI